MHIHSFLHFLHYARYARLLGSTRILDTLLLMLMFSLLQLVITSIP